MIREGMLVEVTHGPLKGVVGRLRAQGIACAAGAVGGSDRPGRQRRSGRGGREGVLGSGVLSEHANVAR